MSFFSKRSGKLCLGLLSISMLVTLLVWGHFIGRYLEHSAEIIRVQPLLSRFVGMQQSEGRFKEADQQVRASLSQLSMEVQGGADAAAAELQRKVRSLAAGHDMSVSGSQILPPVEAQGYQQVGISMTIKGPMQSVPAMLNGLSEMQPRVIVSSTQLSPTRSRRAKTQNVSLRISVLALRTKP